MEAISKERAASVALVEGKVSEAALSYALDTLDESEIERRFGASVDEMEGTRDELWEVLTKHSESLAPEPIANRT